MRRSPLVFIFITVLVDMLGYGMVLPLLPFYVQQQDGGALVAGSLGSLYAAMQLVSGPVLGGLSDRFGRKPILLICLTGTSLAFILLGLASTIELVFLAVMLDGVTGGNLTTAYAYIADVTSPAERSRGMGLVGAAFGLGMIGGPAAGGLLSAYGLAAPAFAAATVAMINVLFGLLVLPESMPKDKREKSVSLKGLNLAAQMGNLNRSGASRLLLAAIFALNLAFAGLQTNFPLFSQARFGWDSVKNGFFFAFVGVSAVLIQGLLYRWIQPLLGERRLARIGLGLMAAGLTAGVLSPVDWLLFPCIGLVAIGSGVSIPSLTGLVSNAAGAGTQGRLMGGMQALLSLAAIIGPALAGLAFEKVSIFAPYLLGSVLALLALWMVARWNQRETKNETLRVLSSSVQELEG
jgi:DHA1 family tetracycline resistance protein-like MFS transporter